MKDVRGKRVTVIGGARSGRAAALLLAGRGAEVFLTEHGALAAETAATLEAAGVGYEQGGHTGRALDADLVAISPGVPTTAPLVQDALGKGLPVYSEVEVASWFCRAPIVAITGTNGKTTTTSLTGHLFRTAGRRTAVAGNIGRAFADYVREANDADVVVLEVSSFQLDHVATFRPRVAVLLNVTPDHLDRYGGDFGAYARSKFRIFENLRAGDALVYNHDDALVREHALEAQARQGFAAYAVSLDAEPDRGGFARGAGADEALVLRLHQPEEVLMHARKLALRGRHNLYNSLAAAVAARSMEIASGAVRESLMSFEGVPHRLERVRELDGVRYVNDSKATNVNAVWYALESFDGPLVLIAGGRDKGNDYAPLKKLVRERVRAVIAIGESAGKVMDGLGSAAPHAAEAESMADAVRLARLFAEPGDTVLLSPACSSFDMFENYEDRGDTFKRIVNGLGA